MRKVKADCDPRAYGSVARVVHADDLASEWEPGLRYLILADESTHDLVERMQASGLDNVFWIRAQNLIGGDVVIPYAGDAVVLYRESDMHHGLQLTNRCNSNCLMCSQPPTAAMDEWMLEETLEAIRHMRRGPAVLGLSGGEPLLLGTGLKRVFDEMENRHPDSAIEVLTNGRLLADAELASDLLNQRAGELTWLVPLYGHADFLHDFVVQAPGAFEQTISGVLALQEAGHAVQLRVVLIRPVLEVLEDLAAYIGRNLPFVREVALMACEPIGFALANREACEVDLTEWTSTLVAATTCLRRYGVPFIFMNTPLCALPTHLHPHAHRSISDWKNVYPPECDACMLKPDCSGLFAWHSKGWMPITHLNVAKEAVK